MGHITYISEEVCKLMEKCDTELSPDLSSIFEDEVWEEYRTGIFRETKERDRQPLGGIRPNALHHAMGTMVGDDSDIPSVRKSVTTGSAVAESDEDNEDAEVGSGGSIIPNEGDVANDQVYFPYQRMNILIY